jgi:putative chitinase
MITYEQFKKIFPLAKQPEAYYDGLREGMVRFCINTFQRECHFLGQCAYESGKFHYIWENTDYSADVLFENWPTIFPAHTALAYAHHDEEIASRLYANRLGNGDEHSEDGWVYRGFGSLQITGKDLHIEFNKFLLDYDGSSLEEAQSAAHNAGLSGAWYWNKHNLNKLADEDNIRGITRIISGSVKTIRERIQWWRKMQEELKDE